MKKVERYFYPAVLIEEPEQKISVVFPDLNCATSGMNKEDALLSAHELLLCVLLGLKEDGETFPKPPPIKDIKLRPNECTYLIDVEF